MRMVRLMTAADAFGAKVVVAQLGVEGILWELKGGGVDGPYPFGPVQVLVAEADLAQAQAVLASTAPLDADRDEQDELDDLEALWAPRRSRRTVLSAAAVLGLLGLVAAELIRLLVIS
jgi:putative signal transducing protein